MWSTLAFWFHAALEAASDDDPLRSFIWFFHGRHTPGVLAVIAKMADYWAAPPVFVSLRRCKLAVGYRTAS